MGRSFLLAVRSFLLTVGLCHFGQLAWSFYLRLKIGLVFLAYGGKLVWSLLLTVSPWPEIGFGLLCLQFPAVSKKDEP